MGANSIQKVPVVADHHRTSRKAFNPFLERTQGVHVDVVGGLVKQQDIGLRLQRHGQVKTVALSTGKHPTFLLLVRAVEIELADVSTAVEQLTSDFHLLIASRHDLPYGFVGVDVRVALVHVANFDRFPHVDASSIGVFLAHDHAEQGGFARTVGPDDAHNARWGQLEGEVLHQEFVAKPFGQSRGFNHLVPQTRSIRNRDVQAGVLLFRALGKHALVVVDPRFVLGASTFGTLADPIQLSVELFATLALLFFFLGQTLALLFQPRGVVPFVRDALTPVELEDPTGDIVEEVAVVRDAQHRALVLLEVLLQPVDGLGIEVVGRLVQKKHIRLLQQQSAQRHPAAFPPAQLSDFLVVRRTTKGVHGDAQLGVKLPGIQGINAVLNRGLAVHQLLHLVGIVEDFLVHEFHVDLLVLFQHIDDLLGPLFHHLADGFGLVEFRLLRQVSHSVAVGPHNLALECFIQSGDDFHDGGLSCAVVADDANLGPVEKREVDVLENVFAGGGRLVDLHHAEDDFLVVRHEDGDSVEMDGPNSPERS